MKQKLFLILMFFSISCTTAHAQHQAEHALIVERLKNWAPEYLTVINNYDNLCITPSTPTLRFLSVITSVNGQSTRGMETWEFYRQIDQGGGFSLTWETKINGENKSFSEYFTRHKGKLLVNDFWPTPLPKTITLLGDDDVDFFSINSFDYLTTGDDQLTDKSMLAEFDKFLLQRGMVRDKRSPDVYLHVAKEENNNIESFYKSEIVTESSGGSFNLGQLLGNKAAAGMNVGGSSTTTKDVGKTVTTINADAYMEFSIIDARRKLSSDYPPVIWKMTYKQHSDEEEISVLDNVRQWIATWVSQYPFHESLVYNHAATWGIFCENFELNPVVSDIVPGSNAAQMGINAGEPIKYVKYKNDKNKAKYYRPGDSFLPDYIISTAEMIQIGKNKFGKAEIKQGMNYPHMR